MYKNLRKIKYTVRIIHTVSTTFVIKKCCTRINYRLYNINQRNAHFVN